MNFNITEDVTDNPIDYEDLITCRSPISSIRFDQSSEVEDNSEKEGEEMRDSENLKEEDEEEEDELLATAPIRIKPDPDQQTDMEIQSDPLDVSAVKAEKMDER